MTIGDHLVERKGLKQVEKGLKEGIKVTHQVKSITWINQSSYFKWVSTMVLGERLLLPSVGAYHLCVGKPSVVLGRLTWKWWSEEHLRCLVEAIKRVDQEKQATPKNRANHDISSGILTLMLSCKHWSKDEASQPQQESALDHKWYSFHMGEEWNSKWYLLVFTNLKIGLHIAIGVMN